MSVIVRGRLPLSIPLNFDLSRTEICFLIDEYIFSARDREILKARFLDGVTYEKLAEQFDLSVRQVKNIIRRSRDQVFRHVDRLLH